VVVSPVLSCPEFKNTAIQIEIQNIHRLLQCTILHKSHLKPAKHEYDDILNCYDHAERFDVPHSSNSACSPHARCRGISGPEVPYNRGHE
jgi:hypothetical protein